MAEDVGQNDKRIERKPLEVASANHDERSAAWLCGDSSGHWKKSGKARDAIIAGILK
ncbi:hypothetical protein PAMC26510_31570 [Caballeronia sordidicola]|uniref:Uncharacterized protein n=1 Tax=Caballeronia sordidicola TaxID=196367 RepID=A0A242M7R8_CABSO|nr:hypothetical protein PAMC26510_31570 [Caballeronia sordidicola]